MPLDLTTPSTAHTFDGLVAAHYPPPRLPNSFASDAPHVIDSNDVGRAARKLFDAAIDDRCAAAHELLAAVRAVPSPPTNGPSDPSEQVALRFRYEANRYTGSVAADTLTAVVKDDPALAQMLCAAYLSEYNSNAQITLCKALSTIPHLVTHEVYEKAFESASTSITTGKKGDTLWSQLDLFRSKPSLSVDDCSKLFNLASHIKVDTLSVGLEWLPLHHALTSIHKGQPSPLTTAIVLTLKDANATRGAKVMALNVADSLNGQSTVDTMTAKDLILHPDPAVSLAAIRFAGTSGHSDTPLIRELLVKEQEGGDSGTAALISLALIGRPTEQIGHLATKRWNACRAWYEDREQPSRRLARWEVMDDEAGLNQIHELSKQIPEQLAQAEEIVQALCIIATKDQGARNTLLDAVAIPNAMVAHLVATSLPTKGDIMQLAEVVYRLFESAPLQTAVDLVNRLVRHHDVNGLALGSIFMGRCIEQTRLLTGDAQNALRERGNSISSALANNAM